MTTIVADSQMTIAVTVFTVAPEQQQQLIDLLARAGREVIRRQPGFVSINIHSSTDGAHVMTYSQWRSREAFDEAVQNAAVIPYVQAVLKLATFEPHFYEVAAVIESEQAAEEGQS